MNSTFEVEYKELIDYILNHGSIERNRTGVSAVTVFDMKIEFDMKTDLMPVLTGKKIFYDKAYHEFIWIFNGLTNIDYLNRHGITWWNEFADEKGELGKTYGYQLRKYNGYFDQIKYLIKEISNGSRRAYITFWNPAELDETALPCCYTGMNFVLTNKGKILNATMSFRSSDVFLGLPYDFIVGALMLRQVAMMTSKKTGIISYNLSNAHIYTNHIDQCLKYLQSEIYELPEDNFTDKLDYRSGPYIKAKLNI